MMTNDINGVVSPYSFYLGRGGWATPVADNIVDHLTLMLNNQTDRFVWFQVVQDEKFQGNTDPIAPWNSLTLPWKCGSTDGSALVSVYDNTSALVATFEIYQSGSDGLPAVQNQKPSDGYGLTSAVCNQRSKDDFFGSSCQITIFKKAAAL